MGDNAPSSPSGRTFERVSIREMTKDQSREDGVPRWADVSNRFALRPRRDYVLKSSHSLNHRISCLFESTVQIADRKITESDLLAG
jgi:hypothetical protein